MDNIRKFVKIINEANDEKTYILEIYKVNRDSGSSTKILAKKFNKIYKIINYINGFIKSIRNQENLHKVTVNWKTWPGRPESPPYADKIYTNLIIHNSSNTYNQNSKYVIIIRSDFSKDQTIKIINQLSESILTEADKRPYRVWIKFENNSTTRKIFRTAEQTAHYLNTVAEHELNNLTWDFGNPDWYFSGDNITGDISMFFSNGVITANKGEELQPYLKYKIEWSNSMDTYYNTNESILTEAQNYKNMFIDMINYNKSLNKNNNLESKINDIINIARTHLKKNDRIIWYLRWWKLIKAMEIFPGSKYIDTVFNKLQIKIGKKINDADISSISTTGYLDHMDHYLSIPYEPIQNVIWNKQRPGELIDQLFSLENQYKEKMSEKENYIQPEEIKESDTIVLKFNDGSAWWLLNRSSCSVEARAMGHCGNSASYYSNEQILSYRIPDLNNSHSWKPHLTFILDNDGYLGEMKGRNNDKPIPKYYPVIMSLLTTKIIVDSKGNKDYLIKGIKGGGYLPDHNFDMSDLTKKQQERVKELNPHLKTLIDLHYEFGDESKELQIAITKKLEGVYITDINYNDELQLWITETFTNKWDIIYDNSNRELRSFIDDILKSGTGLFIMDFVPNSSEKEDFIENLPTDTKYRLDKYIMKKYPEDYNNDENSLLEILEINDDPLGDEISSSINMGISSETENAAWKWLDEVSEDVTGPGGYGRLHTIESTRYKEGKPMKIESYVFGFKTEEIIQVLEDPSLRDDIEDDQNNLIDVNTIDNSIPEFNSEYNEEYAQEYFSDQISEYT